MNIPLMTGVPTVTPTALTQGGHLGLGEAIVLGVATLVTVACGVGVLTAKRTVNAAINMIGTMISLAVLYIVNESPSMGTTQVVVYTGATMTLVLLVTMFVDVGGDESVGAVGAVMRHPIPVLLGLGLAGVLTVVVWHSTLPKPAGSKDGAKAVPDLLTVTFYDDHIVTMELTTILLIAITVGALTLTHHRRIRARLSQRAVAAGKMQGYAAKGAHPGQKPMPGIYASANSAAVPALDTQGEAVEESVLRALRARGQGLEPSDVSPEMGLVQRPDTIVPRPVGAGQTGRTGGPRNARRSGMPFMLGAAVPTVKQPILSDDGAADSAALKQKEEK